LKKLFHYLGDTSLPYRTIMADHCDFYIGDRRIPAAQTVIAEQVHSAHCHICTPEDSGAGFGTHPQINGCDALITNLPNQWLLIRTADCYPILLYDADRQVVAAVHSGREGTRKNIVGTTVATLHKIYKVHQEDLQVWLGPGICQEHYPVSSDVWQDFISSNLANGIKTDDASAGYLDLRTAIVLQLLQAGCKTNSINISGICTYESTRHFSFRRDGTHNRQINLIGMYDE